MRYFKYQDPEGTYEISEEDLRKVYYPLWRDRMEKVGKLEEATFENCIQDFIVVYWAEEINKQ